MSEEQAAVCINLLWKLVTLSTQAQSMLNEGKLSTSQIASLMELLPKVTKEMSEAMSNNQENEPIKETKPANKIAKKVDKKPKRTPVSSQHSAPTTQISKVSHCPDVFLSED